jgi:6-pyruvoyltetrahydropterin/6-carboxytetrahydropterin synthase
MLTSRVLAGIWFVKQLWLRTTTTLNPVSCQWFRVAPHLAHDLNSVTNLTTFHSHYLTTATFEAARQHTDKRLHGHSFSASLQTQLPADFAPWQGGELDLLRTRWEALVQPLDYQHINTLIPEPTDLAIAHWLLQNAHDMGNVQKIALQSTPKNGVEWHANGTFHTWRRYTFYCAHRLPRVPFGHKCGNMHGHSFEVMLQAQDTSADALDAAWSPLHIQLNYTCLNDLTGLENPTSEVLSSWIWQQLQPNLPSLQRVTVFETTSCGAEFDGQTYRIWKDLTLDSAVRFAAAPAGNPRRQLHGHTYRLRLHLSAPLDTVMGWTVDFGDVKTLFTPIFKLLDHKPLYEIADLADCDTAHIAHWILSKARAVLPEISAVELHETKGHGVVVW